MSQNMKKRKNLWVHDSTAILHLSHKKRKDSLETQAEPAVFSL